MPSLRLTAQRKTCWHKANVPQIGTNIWMVCGSPVGVGVPPVGHLSKHACRLCRPARSVRRTSFLSEVATRRLCHRLATSRSNAGRCIASCWSTFSREQSFRLEVAKSSISSPLAAGCCRQSSSIRLGMAIGGAKLPVSLSATGATTLSQCPTYRDMPWTTIPT